MLIPASGFTALWSPDGEDIYFASPDAKNFLAFC